MPSELTTEHIALANLAAQFLPKIDLPTGWQGMDTTALRQTVHQASDPSLRTNNIPIAHPTLQKEITPFEIIAEEAITRARILLDTAAGIQRPARQAGDQQIQSLAAAVKRDIDRKQARAEERAMWQAKFAAKTAKLGRATLTGTEVLCLVYPRSKNELIRHYWREFYRAKCQDDDTSVKVVFDDEPRPAAAHIVINDLLGDAWTQDAFIAYAPGAKRHYDEHGNALRRQWNHNHPKCVQGGEQTAKANKKRRDADTAKNGGEAHPNIDEIVKGVKDGKLNKAVRKWTKKASKPKAKR